MKTRVGGQKMERLKEIEDEVETVDISSAPYVGHSRVVQGLVPLGYNPYSWNECIRPNQPGRPLVRGMPDTRDYDANLTAGGNATAQGCVYFDGALRAGGRPVRNRLAYEYASSLQYTREGEVTVPERDAAGGILQDSQGNELRRSVGHPDAYKGKSWTNAYDAAVLRRCPVYDHKIGFDYHLAVAFAEAVPRYGAGLSAVDRARGISMYLTIPGGCKVPPTAVMTHEWQKRVLVPLTQLSTEFRNLSHGKERYLREVTGRRLMEELHSRFLKDIFVRRQRFEDSGGRNTHGALVGLRAKHHNLSDRVVPGRFATWFVRSWADDQMVEDIIHLDDTNAWPHHRHEDYAVEPAVAIERTLLQRDFRFREHARDPRWTVMLWQKYEAGLITDIRHCRALVNHYQVLVDVHNKELGWLDRDRTHHRNTYVRVPKYWNEKVGYPHGFIFVPETPLLTLLAHRLAWNVATDNPFVNGVWIALLTNRAIRMIAAWLRQVYTHLRLWWLPPFVRSVARDPAMRPALIRALASEKNTDDMLLLMRRMHEVVPTEADWREVSWRNRTSPRLACPRGVDVGRQGHGGDYLRFNPWTDRCLSAEEWHWDRAQLPHTTYEECMPPYHPRGFAGWDEGSLEQDLCYADVRLRGRRPYAFTPLPTPMPAFVARAVIRDEVQRVAYYRQLQLQAPKQAKVITEAPGRTCSPEWVPAVPERAFQLMHERRLKGGVPKPDLVAEVWSAADKAYNASFGCTLDLTKRHPRVDTPPLPYRMAGGAYDVAGTSAFEKDLYDEYNTVTAGVGGIGAWWEDDGGSFKNDRDQNITDTVPEVPAEDPEESISNSADAPQLLDSPPSPERGALRSPRVDANTGSIPMPAFQLPPTMPSLARRDDPIVGTLTQADPEHDIGHDHACLPGYAQVWVNLMTASLGMDVEQLEAMRKLAEGNNSLLRAMDMFFELRVVVFDLLHAKASNEAIVKVIGYHFRGLEQSKTFATGQDGVERDMKSIEQTYKSRGTPVEDVIRQRLATMVPVLEESVDRSKKEFDTETPVLAEHIPIIVESLTAIVQHLSWKRPREREEMSLDSRFELMVGKEVTRRRVFYNQAGAGQYMAHRGLSAQAAMQASVEAAKARTEALAAATDRALEAEKLAEERVARAAPAAGNDGGDGSARKSGDGQKVGSDGGASGGQKDGPGDGAGQKPKDGDGDGQHDGVSAAGGSGSKKQPATSKPASGSQPARSAVSAARSKKRGAHTITSDGVQDLTGSDGGVRPAKKRKGAVKTAPHAHASFRVALEPAVTYRLVMRDHAVDVVPVDGNGDPLAHYLGDASHLGRPSVVVTMEPAGARRAIFAESIDEYDEAEPVGALPLNRPN